MALYGHHCKYSELLYIDEDSIEFEDCLCEIDSDGKGPQFRRGDQVEIIPMKNAKATVLFQKLSYDYPEAFWGNVIVERNDTKERVETNNWQLKMLGTTQGGSNDS